MIIFLYGSDTYRSQKKANELIAKYKTKYKSGLNLHRLDFLCQDLEDLKQLSVSRPMFQEKKLIILENIFKKNNEEQKKIKKFFQENNFEKSKEIILLIYEKQIPEKQTELFKNLTKKPNIFQKFENLEGVKLENWVREEVVKREKKIENKALKKLIEYTGGNLWRIINEIEKLVLYSLDKEIISENEVDLLVKEEISLNIFHTVDALAKRDKKTALRLLYQHLAQKENENYLLTMFVYHFRNLLRVKDLAEKGISFYQVLQKTGLPSFVVKKLFEQIKNFNPEELKKFYSKLLNADIAIKAGKIEPKVALDMLVIAT